MAKTVYRFKSDLPYRVVNRPPLKFSEHALQVTSEEDAATLRGNSNVTELPPLHPDTIKTKPAAIMYLRCIGGNIERLDGPKTYKDISAYAAELEIVFPLLGK